MPDVTRRSAVLTGLGVAAAPVLAGLASEGAASAKAPAKAAKKAPSAPGQAHKFEMNIEDTRITLVGDQKFHTFAYGGQVPGPLFHVREGDEVECTINNLTTLPHTIHWHGMLQRGTWRHDGVPDMTQRGVQPGDSFTYKFIADPAGTMWYHCHVNVNEHVATRGMWGPFIVEPKKPLPIEKEITGDYILMLSEWASAWADKPGQGGIPGDVFDYFTINGKSFPETQPIRVKEGDVIRIRLFGAGEGMHSIHIHGHVFQIMFKDGHPLPGPINADTVLVGPGERYDVILRCDNPGRWMIHDHVDSHTMNGHTPHGGIMTLIEYDEIPRDDDFYHWAHKQFVPDFYYEESLKKPHGVYTNPVFKGEPIL
ncbi:multicopper oxidase domain-containing protein [Allosphingosinicella humi]